MDPLPSRSRSLLLLRNERDFLTADPEEIAPWMPRRWTTLFHFYLDHHSIPLVGGRGVD